MRDSTIETIGCDLGDKYSTVCVLTADDRKEERRVRTTKKGMTDFFGARRPAHVVIEVGTHSRWVNALLVELGHRVTVANPVRLQLISASCSKDDRSDAELLARLGRADLQLLAPVKHRGEKAQTELAVTKSRDVLVRTRTKLVNYVRGIVKATGERLRKCTAESFHRRTEAEVPEGLRQALEPVYRTLEAIDEQIDELDRSIKRIADRHPEVARVSQPNGVGVLTALVFVLTLEDKARFKKSRSVGAYLGLRTKKSQSGDDDPQLRITKAGDGFVRRLLVNSANHILGPFGQDSDLRRWGLQLASRGGKNARKRAKVAVARKLAVLMHRLWVSGEDYVPIGHGQHRAAA